MKKTAALVLAAVMAAAMAFTAFAENPTSGSTEVKYSPDAESYTITIPATCSITAADTDVDLEIKGNDVKVLLGRSLFFKVASGNGWKMKNGASAIEYTAKLGATVLTNDATVLEIKGVGTKTAAAEADSKATLKVQSTTAQINAATVAGEHTDTLTFTVSIGTATTPAG